MELVTDRETRDARQGAHRPGPGRGARARAGAALVGHVRQHHPGAGPAHGRRRAHRRGARRHGRRRSRPPWDGPRRWRDASTAGAWRRSWPRRSGAFARRIRGRSRCIERAGRSLLGGVPMHWMVRWAGGFPLFVEGGEGAQLTDVDGHRYLDLCLGDTGAMTGHAPPATVDAVRAQAGRGFTFMLPTEDAVWVGEELARRFGLPYWQFAVTATDANRFAIRLAREITGRPKILVFNWCYHGTVDETFVTLRDGRAVRARREPRPAGRSVRSRPGSSSSTTCRRSRPPSPTATWPACSPSRRSPTSASCTPSPGSMPRCASSPGAPAPCSSSTRPTPSAPGPAATPARTASSPTSSRSASRWPAASRRRSTA